MAQPQDISIVILNWNAADDTIRCAQSIARWRSLRPAVWVVDNASVDGSAGKIVRACPQVHLIRNSANEGYAGGNNRGLAEALAASEAPVLLLNNDVTVAEEDVKLLLESLRANPLIGFIGPLLFDADHKERLLAAGGRDMVRHLTSHISRITSAQHLQVVDYVPGTVLLARAEVFRLAGLLDEAYYFTGEIPDLCRRARRYRYLSAVDTRARAFHTLIRSAGYRNSLYPYYIIRNRFLFIRKHYARSKFLFYAFWSFYSLALSLKLHLSGQHDMAWAVRLGLRDGLRGRFGGQNERVLAGRPGVAGVQPAGPSRL